MRRKHGGIAAVGNEDLKVVMDAGKEEKSGSVSRSQLW